MGDSVPKYQRSIITLSRFGWLGAAAFILAVILLTATAWSAGESQPGQPENEPILITADQLISDNEDRYAEFIGKVKATWGDFIITSDKLRIYYQGDLLEAKKKGGDEELIKKIVATGNVKITTEQYNAESERAEYDTAAMTVVLSGANSKVTSGKNSIIGSTITMNQKTGQVKVEGSADKRIKAEFYTKEKPSTALKKEKSEE
jgi:lipopolysaccharide export system protein LptA